MLAWNYYTVKDSFWMKLTIALQPESSLIRDFTRAIERDKIIG